MYTNVVVTLLHNIIIGMCVYILYVLCLCNTFPCLCIFLGPLGLWCCMMRPKYASGDVCKPTFTARSHSRLPQQFSKRWLADFIIVTDVFFTCNLSFWVDTERKWWKIVLFIDPVVNSSGDTEQLLATERISCWLHSLVKFQPQKKLQIKSPTQGLLHKCSKIIY